MVVILALALFAQTNISVRIGSDAKKSDSAAAAVRAEANTLRREARNDSLRARRAKHDSIDKERRLSKRIPLTPALLSSAFRDPGARALLNAARAARLDQDTSLRGYDATSYERMSIGMGFKRIGRDRLLMRNERAAHCFT